MTDYFDVGEVASVKQAENVRYERGLDQLRAALLAIQDLIQSPETEDIHVNEDGAVIWNITEKALCLTIKAERRMAIINAVASLNGTIINSGKPFLEAMLPPEIGDGRFTALIPPVVSAPCFSIRSRPKKIYDFKDYYEAGIMTATQAGLLIDEVLLRRNVLIVGATGSGKTTLTNTCLKTIADVTPEDRIVTLEDTMELRCASLDKVQLHTKNALEAAERVTMSDLLRLALRLNPTRIIVGEVRGAEALDLLKAWNTGHPGGISTIHADSAIAGLYRLEECCMEATAAPQQQRIARTINVAVFIEATPEGRRVREIIRVTGYADGKYQTEAL